MRRNEFDSSGIQANGEKKTKSLPVMYLKL